MPGYDETTPPLPLDPVEEIANEAKRQKFAAKIKELEARIAATEPTHRAQPPRRTASTISDDELDQLYAVIAEVRRVVETARHTRTGSQAADRAIQALTAGLLGILGPAPADISGGFYPDMTGGRCVACHLADMRGNDEHLCEALAAACDCECRAALDGTTPTETT